MILHSITDRHCLLQHATNMFWKLREILRDQAQLAPDANNVLERSEGWKRANLPDPNEYDDKLEAMLACETCELGLLNEMHEAIITKFVTIEMQQKFAMQLRNVIKKAPPFASRSWSDWDLITAPLPQLSEAFLRTLGLLEEEQ